MKKVVSMTLFAGLVLAIAAAYGQDVGVDRFVVAFSDPSRPGLLKVNLINSGISVKSHAGQDVIIESKSNNNRNRRRPLTTPDGLRRIDTDNLGLAIEEENNVMSITARNPNNSGDIEVQVPAKTNLNLKTVNGGDIVVEGVEGEIEIANTNGNVLLTNVAGSVVAHATNGRLVASLRDATPNKPMSFTSMNANVEITLLSTTKANLKMRIDNGVIYSDFDIQLCSVTAIVEDQRSRGGNIRIQTDRTINGTINGGGSDFDLRTLNGNIYIRKSK